MDFALSQAQQQMREQIIAFAQRTLNRQLAERDACGTFEMDHWRACAEQGIQGLFIPTEYGGGGHDMVTTIAALEALGYGCHDNGLTLGLNGQMWSVQEPLLHFGSEEQKQRFLPGLCKGELIGAHGMTEAHTGSDAFALSTSAVPRDDGYVLNGHKIYIGMAPACDIALVFASTDPSVGQWGISAFIVESSREGFARSAAQSKMGLRTSPLGELTLTDCWVPQSNRLGPLGAGVSIFNNSMEWERSFIFASHVGSMHRQLDAAVQYARERKQFDQPIGKFQWVSNRIVEMKMRLETSRMLLYKAAWMKERGERCATEAAMAKLHIGEAFLASSIDAMRIFGGRGYLTEFEVERDLRDAAGGVIYSGTSDIQRQVIARLLGL